MNRIKEWVIKKVIERILNKEGKMLKGYATTISAVLMVITGALQLLGISPEFMVTSVHGMDLVLAGLATFGIGRKLSTLEAK